MMYSDDKRPATSVGDKHRMNFKPTHQKKSLLARAKPVLFFTAEIVIFAAIAVGLLALGAMLDR